MEESTLNDRVSFLASEAKRLESRIEKIKAVLGTIADVLRDYEERIAALEQR